MPLTNETVVQAHEALVALIKNDKEESYKMPLALRVLLAENLNLTVPVIEWFSKQHNALVAKYGTRQKDGTDNVTDPEKLKAFTLERTSILNEVSSIEDFYRFSVADLGDNQVGIDLLALLLKTGMLTK